MTTTPATKILNKVYARHLIKVAQGYKPTPKAPSAPLTGDISAGGTARTGWGGDLAPTPVKPFSAPGARGTAATNTLRPMARNTNQPDIAASFLGGMGQGVQNMFGGAYNFGRGAANLVGGTLATPFAYATGLTGSRPQPGDFDVGHNALNHAVAGGLDMLSAPAQFLGLNQAFGWQNPSAVTQAHQAQNARFYSNPRDRGLQAWQNGFQGGGDALAGMLPATFAGQGATAALSRVPQVAAAANTLRAVPSSVRNVAQIATGVPLSTSKGALLPAATMASQFGQQYAQFANAPGARYLPVNLVDNSLRKVDPNLPETLDAALGLPASVPWSAVAQGVVQAETGHPNVDDIARYPEQYAAQQQAAQQQAQLAEQQLSEDRFLENSGGILANALGQAENRQLEQQLSEDRFLSSSGGLFDDALRTGPSQHFRNKIEGLIAKDAPAQEMNAVFDEYLQHAGKNMPVEEYDQLQQNVTQVRETLTQLSPEEKQRALDAIMNPESAAGQQLIENKRNEVGQAAADAAAANVPPANTPQEFGAQQNSVMQAWTNAVEGFNKMDQMSQIGVGLGLGAGVLGMLSGLGGGGIGSFLLGALGLGAAGMMGANAGMFGQSGSQMMGDMAYNLGTMTGLVPESADLSALKGENALQRLMSQGGAIGSREEVKAQIAGVRDQAGKLQQLMSLPLGDEAKIRLMQRLDPSIDSLEAGQQALTNAQQIMAAYNDPNSALNKKLLAGENYASMTGWQGDLTEKGIGAAQTAGASLGRMANTATDYLTNLFTKRNTDMNIAQQIIIEQLITKSARCWAGYEPVPGKKPYSNDSCRPVGSKKKKKKQAEKKAAGPVLPSSASPPVQSFSKTPFDAQHMIQTLGMHASTKPHLAYNKAMNLWKNNKFTPAQFSALHAKYQGLPPRFSQPTQNLNPAPPASTAPMTGANQAYQQWRATQGL